MSDWPSLSVSELDTRYMMLAGGSVIEPALATTTGITIKLHPSQSVDGFKITDHNDVVLFAVDQTGKIGLSSLPATIATQAELDAHAAAADPHPGYRLESVPITAAMVAADIATQAELDAHTGAADPHTGYRLESVGLLNADIASGAAIDYSKLALTGAILEADLAFGIATQSELDASALLGLLKAPADAARNTIQPTANVPAVTHKAPASVGASEYTSASYVSRSDQQWVRFVLPQNPLPAQDSHVGPTGRIDFPYMGTGKAPVGVSTWQTLFDGTPCPGIALGYNIRGGGSGYGGTGRITEADQVAGGWVVEPHWDQGGAGVHVFEGYLQFDNGATNLNIRPLYILLNRDGATLADVLTNTVISGAPIRLSTYVGNTERENFKLDANGILVGNPIRAGVVANHVLQVDGTLKAGGAAGQQEGFVVLGDDNSALRHVGMYRSASTGAIGGNYLNLGGYDGVIISAGATTLGLQNQVLRIAADATINLTNGSHLTFGTGTGTKFGTATTQKLAFWNATPIVQPAATVALEQVLSNLGLRATGSAAPLNVGKVSVTPAAGDHGLLIDKTAVGGQTGVQMSNQTIGTMTSAWQCFIPSGSTDFVIGRAGIFDALRLNGSTGSITLWDAANIVVGTTTGTKIGTGATEKLGLWGKTPVVQPAAVADVSGGAIIDIECRAQVNALLARLRAPGFIAT